MKLIMDGELYGSELKSQELLDKLNAYMEEQKGAGKVVRHCLINGEETPDFQEQLPKYLKKNLVDEVEIVTVHQDELAQETLTSAIEYIDNLNDYVQTISEQLGKDQGFKQDPFLRLTDGLEWLYQISTRLAQLYENEEIRACHEELYKVFQRLNTCLEREDFTCLKIVIEDELRDNLNHTQTIFEAQLNKLKNQGEQ